MRWCEGPAWFGDARCLIWSDIPNNALMRWDEETGAVSVYRKPSNHANGNTRDRQGRLISCEHETRRVTRTEYDGSITVLMDRFEGKRLNSPNDVSVKSDDSIWFSDPPFGIRTNYQGNIAPSELPSNIYRLDPRTAQATVVAGTLNRYTEDAIDLCDVLSSFSSQGKAKLHELCRVMGLQGKPDGMSGGEVEKYYRDGRINEIA